MKTSETETAPPKRRRLGLMGGTFDPVHNGHLLIANEAGWRLELDKVRLYSDRRPPHKQDHYITPARCRLEMVRLATQDNPLSEVSAIEIERPGLSYTAQTLRALHEDYGEEDRPLLYYRGGCRRRPFKLERARPGGDAGKGPSW